MTSAPTVPIGPDTLPMSRLTVEAVGRPPSRRVGFMPAVVTMLSTLPNSGSTVPGAG